MRGSGSDAESTRVTVGAVPPVVAHAAREVVRRKLVVVLSATLAAVVLIQSAILLVILRRPLERLHIPDATFLEPQKIEKRSS